MRTTLTVDDDLLFAAKQQATRIGLSVSEVINRALRRALTEYPTTGVGEACTVTYGAAKTPDPRLEDERLREIQRELDEADLPRETGLPPEDARP